MNAVRVRLLPRIALVRTRTPRSSALSDSYARFASYTTGQLSNNCDKRKHVLDRGRPGRDSWLPHYENIKSASCCGDIQRVRLTILHDTCSCHRIDPRRSTALGPMSTDAVTNLRDSSACTGPSHRASGCRPADSLPAEP